MSEWQPIETAPKGDEPILLWGKSDNHWNGPDYSKPEQWSDERVYLLRYQYEDDASPLGRVFVTTELDGIGAQHLHCWPTHWMPLSSPPSD